MENILELESRFRSQSPLGKHKNIEFNKSKCNSLTEAEKTTVGNNDYTATGVIAVITKLLSERSIYTADCLPADHIAGDISTNEN